MTKDEFFHLPFEEIIHMWNEDTQKARKEDRDTPGLMTWMANKRTELAPNGQD